MIYSSATDYDILKQLEEQIDPDLLCSSRLTLSENKGDYNSVLIESPPTPYRGNTNANKNVLFCRIKNTKQKRYMSFSQKYEQAFIEAGFNVTSIASDEGFIRIDIGEFLADIEKSHSILNTIFKESFSFESFGCCSKYKECSAAAKCLHEDQVYALACMYRKNLESGKIFYKDERISNDTFINEEKNNEEEHAEIVYPLISPTGNWTQFQNADERLLFLKEIKLLPQKAVKVKDFYYNGIFVKDRVKCIIKGFVSNDVLVIQINGQLHCIAAEYFKELQPTQKELGIIPKPKIYEVYDNIVVLDTETTGLTSNDKLIEVSMLKVINGEITDRFSVLVNPGMPISTSAAELTGITDDMVITEHPISVYSNRIIDFIGDSCILGHNVLSFDLRFLRNELGKPISNKVIDTLYISRELLPLLDHHSLEDIASFYDIDYSGAHRSERDCEITLECFEKLTGSLKKAEIKKIRSLK